MEFTSIIALVIVGFISVICLAVLAPLILGFIGYTGALAYTYIDGVFNEHLGKRRLVGKNKNSYHFHPYKLVKKRLRL